MEDSIGEYLDYTRAITYLAQDGVRVPSFNGVKLNRDSFEYFLLIARHNDEKDPQIDSKRLRMAFGTRKAKTLCQLTQILINAELIKEVGEEKNPSFILTEDGKKFYKTAKEQLAYYVRSIGFRVDNFIWILPKTF